METMAAFVSLYGRLRTQTDIVDDESWIQFLLGLNFMTDVYSARSVSRIAKHVEPVP